MCIYVTCNRSTFLADDLCYCRVEIFNYLVVNIVNSHSFTIFSFKIVTYFVLEITVI